MHTLLTLQIQGKIVGYDILGDMGSMKAALISIPSWVIARSVQTLKPTADMHIS